MTTDLSKSIMKTSLYNDKALVLIQPTDIYINCDQTDELRLISETFQWDR